MDREIFNRKVIPLFALTLMITAIGTFIGFMMPPILYIPVVIAEFVVLIIAVFARRKGDIRRSLLFAFSVLSGITLAPIIYWAVGTTGDIMIVAEALAITAGVFYALAFYVWRTNKDFTSIGSFLFFALIGAIIASVINIFIGGSVFGIIIDVAVLLIFMGFVLYDMSTIIRKYPNNAVNGAVLSLYIDFINIFVRILELLVWSRRD
ncbi:MAG: Bax inhibitor-1/YccA family protein [Candidatus Micrarchaeota archaeon]|nr:Bax inhibitor-1/YccA family protein [Candidatus Micrarchaeota archaeon]